MEYTEIFNQIENATTKAELKTALVALFDKKMREGSITDEEELAALARVRANIAIHL